MASAREYRNLKEYRDKELKWFLLANIILMLIESGVLDFGKLDSISISDISSLLGITAVSSAIYIYTFILDSILPSRVKVFLVFLWKRQPSCTIFTDMEQKFEDDRFKLEDAKKKYHQIYERIKSEPDSFDQTPLWYEIYNKHRNNTIIFGSNRDYLLLRDHAFADDCYNICLHHFMVVLRSIILFMEVCNLLDYYDCLSQYWCARSRQKNGIQCVIY